jgi:hypothetical protein
MFTAPPVTKLIGKCHLSSAPQLLEHVVAMKIGPLPLYQAAQRVLSRVHSVGSSSLRSILATGLTIYLAN